MFSSPIAYGRTGLDIDALFKELSMRYTKCNHTCFKFRECKSDDEAYKYRCDGNAEFERKEYGAAITSFTQSIAWAVTDSKELVLGYAHRAGLLFTMSEYQTCLFDINRVLNGKCPEHFRRFLLSLKKRCLMRVNEDENLSKRVKARATGPSHLKTDSEEWRKMCNFGNPLISGASPKVRLSCSKKWGRHMVATENIEPGEILSSQKFFIVTPHEDEVYKNCSFCLSKCVSLMPCPSCSKMMYCSEHCLKQAYDVYHKIECKLMAFEGMSTADLKFLPLRMLLTGTKQGADLQNLMEKLTIHDIFAEAVDFSEKPFKNDYLSALHLCKNYDPSFVKMNIPLAVESTIMLEKTEFFESDESETPEYNLQSRLYVIMLLINHLMAVRYLNVVTLWSKPGWTEARTHVGAGISTLHTFINHSCYPNVRWFIRDREHVIVATRPIQKGDQIFVSYVDTFSHCPIDERRGKLFRNHRFICECEACSNQWPVFTIPTAPMVQFRNTILNAKQPKGDFKKMVSPIVDGNIKSLKDDILLQIICDTCKWVYAYIKEPALSYTVQCEECVWKLISCMYADDFSPEYATDLNTELERTFKQILKCIQHSYRS